MTTMIPAWVGGTLTPVEKLEVHRRGLRHKAVSVFVTSGGRTLIQRRALSKYHTPGLWANACCTHPAWGEEPLACALRRLREELGITGLDLVHRHQIAYRAPVGGGLVENELVDIFTARADPLLSFTPDPAEVSEAIWVDLADLTESVLRQPGRFTPWLRIYLTRHSDAIFAV